MDTDKETIINDQNEAGTLYVAWLTMTEDIANEINEGKMSFEISGFEDLAGNVGDVITTGIRQLGILAHGRLKHG